jgi:hypothetical protein
VASRDREIERVSEPHVDAGRLIVVRRVAFLDVFVGASQRLPALPEVVAAAETERGA